MRVALLTGEREPKAFKFRRDRSDDHIHLGILAFQDDLFIRGALVINHLPIYRPTHQRYKPGERPGHPLVGRRRKIIGDGDAPIFSPNIVMLESGHHNPHDIKGLERRMRGDPRDISGLSRQPGDGKCNGKQDKNSNTCDHVGQFTEDGLRQAIAIKHRTWSTFDEP